MRHANIIMFDMPATNAGIKIEGAYNHEKLSNRLLFHCAKSFYQIKSHHLTFSLRDIFSTTERAFRGLRCAIDLYMLYKAQYCCAFY